MNLDLNLSRLLVEISMTLLGLFVLIIDLWIPGDRKKLTGYIAFFGMLLILALMIFVPANHGEALQGSYVLDTYAMFFKLVFACTLLFVIIMSIQYIDMLSRGPGEFFALLIFCGIGMMIMASTNDFMVLFVALELTTISFYVLTTYLVNDLKSIESGLKYLVLGALSSGFLLYGISFIYGVTGSTNFNEVHQVLMTKSYSEHSLFPVVGCILIIIGMAFKIAAVPFHVWVPDVYQGAPTTITAFLSVGSKAAGFALFLRILFGIFLPLEHEWALLIAIFSAFTIFLGNLGAIPQTNIKRFLGYSSIGQAGYILLGLAAANALGASSILFYLFAYAFTNMTAFLVVIAFFYVARSDEILDYSGLFKRSKLLATAMTIALLSLAGVPPLAGFFGKFMLLSAVVQKGGLMWLAVIGAINVAISLYYYLCIIKRMFMHEPKDTSPINVAFPMKLALYVGMIFIVIIGIYQAPLMNFAESAVEEIFTFVAVY